VSLKYKEYSLNFLLFNIGNDAEYTVLEHDSMSDKNLRKKTTDLFKIVKLIANRTKLTVKY